MKKRFKINLNKIIFIFIIIIIGVFILLFYTKIRNNEEFISDTIIIKKYKNKDYYIIKDDYKGEYDLQFINFPQYYHSQANELEDFEKKELMNYSEYESYCNKWGLKKVYSDESKNYIVFSYTAYGAASMEARLAGIEYIENIANLYIWDNVFGNISNIAAYAIIMSTEKEINEINIVGLYTKEQFNNIKKYDTSDNQYDPTFKKPIIYLYPTKEIEVSIKLLNFDRITSSYPKYINGWNVLASPNGDLIDLDTGRYLYSLYYESESEKKFSILEEGFVIEGKESISFLEEKLEILGLNERETQEFIIYWLPKLENNKYNYIRFATFEEINNNMSLKIDPNPDTFIRVLMTFKGLETPIEVKEQKLDSPERNGFTVVEWGGTEIK